MPPEYVGVCVCVPDSHRVSCPPLPFSDNFARRRPLLFGSTGTDIRIYVHTYGHSGIAQWNYQSCMLVGICLIVPGVCVFKISALGRWVHMWVCVCVFVCLGVCRKLDTHRKRAQRELRGPKICSFMVYYWFSGRLFGHKNESDSGDVVYVGVCVCVWVCYRVCVCVRFPAQSVFIFSARSAYIRGYDWEMCIILLKFTIVGPALIILFWMALFQYSVLPLSESYEPRQWPHTNVLWFSDLIYVNPLSDFPDNCNAVLDVISQ